MFKTWTRAVHLTISCLMGINASKCPAIRADNRHGDRQSTTGTPTALNNMQVSGDLLRFYYVWSHGCLQLPKIWPKHLTLNRITYWLHSESDRQTERKRKQWMRVFGNMGVWHHYWNGRDVIYFRDLGVCERKCNKIPAECQVISYRCKQTGRKITIMVWPQL